MIPSQQKHQVLKNTQLLSISDKRIPMLKKQSTSSGKMDAFMTQTSKTDRKAMDQQIAHFFVWHQYSFFCSWPSRVCKIDSTVKATILQTDSNFLKTWMKFIFHCCHNVKTNYEEKIFFCPWMDGEM